MNNTLSFVHTYRLVVKISPKFLDKGKEIVGVDQLV